MPRPPAVPRLYPHSARGVDRCRIPLGHGRYREVVTGPTGSDESRRKYAEILAEFARTGSYQPERVRLTVAELVAWWAEYAARTYRPDSPEPLQFRYALAPLVELYADLPAVEFSPKKLKVIQQHLAGRGLSRRVLNRRVVRIRTLFRAAASEELIPGEVAAALSTVRALPRGAPGVREKPAVGPPPADALERVLPFLHATVRSMLELQGLTGMRSQEVRLLRPCDVDRGGDVWLYRCAAGKNAWRGQERIVALGPQAQAVLAPWLVRAADAYCFDPGPHRKRPTDRPRSHYDAEGYAQAVRQACKRAGVKLTPGQLRHEFKRRALAAGSVGEARAAMGHQSAQAFDHYAAGVDVRAAADLARRIG